VAHSLQAGRALVPKGGDAVPAFPTETKRSVTESVEIGVNLWTNTLEQVPWRERFPHHLRLAGTHPTARTQGRLAGHGARP